MILSLVPLTPAAAPPNRLQGCVFTREFPLRIKRRRAEMRFAIDASDPRATNPDPVLLTEVKRARRCYDALVSGRISSLAELDWSPSLRQTDLPPTTLPKSGARRVPLTLGTVNLLK